MLRSEEVLEMASLAKTAGDESVLFANSTYISP